MQLKGRDTIGLISRDLSCILSSTTLICAKIEKDVVCKLNPLLVRIGEKGREKEREKGYSEDWLGVISAGPSGLAYASTDTAQFAILPTYTRQAGGEGKGEGDMLTYVSISKKLFKRSSKFCLRHCCSMGTTPISSSSELDRE